ncbi:phosphoglycerate mutase-like protein [Marasmius fiardii PR-910]|nr:phosphoglycerate mutase-like protein [Marasmius fiardii PR-910]
MNKAPCSGHEESAVRVVGDDKREALLPVHTKQRNNHEPSAPTPSQFTKRSFSLFHVAGAFAGGFLACILAQYAVYNRMFIISYLDALEIMNSHQETAVHHFPPTSATNVFPTLFPTDVGFSSETPTGAEPALIATAPAYPIHTGAAQLVVPEILGSHKEFDLLKSWGTLSPWYSIEKGAFGIDSGLQIPDECRVTGLHLLHKHGARYPHSEDYGGPAGFAGRLNKVARKLKASGDLDFLNEWCTMLTWRNMVLTPFGRQQLYDLGISMRLKYGFLLQNFSGTNTIPVFRTGSQNRILNSALNFALGFFWLPIGSSDTILNILNRWFNNTLAQWQHACPNINRDSASGTKLFTWYLKRWAEKYLKSAKKRLQPQLSGLKLTTEDVYTMQQMCAYESIAIGDSKFCELFTQEEWEGFDYSHDLSDWYKSGFGSSVGHARAAGWIQEMIHRLEHKPVTKETNRFSTNFTLDGDIRTFPVNQSPYVDATHEENIIGVITALNLTTFAEDGPLSYDHIPKERKFRTSQLSSYGSNIQFQLLSCSGESEPQTRIIINDGVVPLAGIEGCHPNEYSLCTVETFVRAQKKMLDMVDWDWACVVVGRSPSQKHFCSAHE